MNARRIAWTVLVMAGSAEPGFSLGDTVSYRDPHAGPIQSVCMLPVEAQLSKVGLKGGEALPKESEAWAAELRDAVKHAMNEAGAQIAGDLSPEALEGNERLHQSVFQVQHRFASVAVQMNKKPREVEKGRYTLGDEVALLPCAARADSLLFIHGEGSLLTDGRKTLSVLTSGAASFFTARSKFKLRLAFVNSTTGSVKALILVDSLGDKARNNPDEAYGKDLGKEFATLQMGTGTVAQTATGPKEKRSFSITLSTAQSTWKSGERIAVHAILVNQSGRKIRLASEKSASLDFNIAMLDPAGKQMNITPGSVASGVRGQKYSLLPGNTVEFDLALSDIYDLKPPGEYSVEFRRRDDESLAMVGSNKVVITVTN